MNQRKRLKRAAAISRARLLARPFIRLTCDTREFVESLRRLKFAFDRTARALSRFKHAAETTLGVRNGIPLRPG